MNLEDRFLFFIFYPGQRLQAFHRFFKVGDVFEANGHFADFYLLQAQQFFNIVDVDVTVASARSADLFDRPGDFEVKAVDRALLVGCDQYDGVARLDVHPFCQELRHQYLALFHSFDVRIADTRSEERHGLTLYLGVDGVEADVCR